MIRFWWWWRLLTGLMALGCIGMATWDAVDNKPALMAAMIICVFINAFVAGFSHSQIGRVK